ncbi:hypothetical protein Efla_005620 [Eimeria flavescens]
MNEEQGCKGDAKLSCFEGAPRGPPGAARGPPGGPRRTVASQPEGGVVVWLQAAKQKMEEDGFKAVRRRRGHRKGEAAPYEGGVAQEEDGAAAVQGALMHAGTAAAEEAAAALLRRVEHSEGDSEGEDSGEEEGGAPPEAMDAEGAPRPGPGAPTKGKKEGRRAAEQKACRRAAAEKKEQQEQPFIRRLPVPQHRYTPLKQQWVDLIKPLIIHMKLQVRMNLKRRCVEIRAAPAGAAAAAAGQLADDNTRLQKGADYIRAFLLGFEQRDCVALLRLDDMYLETFEIQDVKKLTGAHFSRCIGRLTGRNGSTRFAIENATRTRIVVAGRKIHILGSFDCIKLARHSICSLILGKPQGKVYCHLRTVAKRLSQRL